MISFIIAWLLGDLTFQQLPELPSQKFIIVLMGLSLFLLILTFYFRKTNFFLILLLFYFIGFLWTYYYVNSLLSWQLAKTAETKPLLIIGRIASLPSHEKFG